MLLNNDTLFDGDFIAGTLEFQARNGAQLIAPAVTYADHPDRFWFADGGYTHARGGFQAWMGESLRDGPYWTADFAPGCALLVGMSVIDRIDARRTVLRLLGRCRLLHAVPGCRYPGHDHQGTDNRAQGQCLDRWDIAVQHPDVPPQPDAVAAQAFRNGGAWLQVPAIVGKIAYRRVSGRDDSKTTALRLRTVAGALLSGKAGGEERPCLIPPMQPSHHARTPSATLCNWRFSA
jgi:hypothetical protein